MAISHAEKMIPAAVKEAVHSVVPSAELILFGSRARGDFETDSDWDFLVLVDGDADWELNERIHDALFEVQLETGAPVCTVVESRETWDSAYSRATPFHKNVDKDGRRV